MVKPNYRTGAGMHVVGEDNKRQMVMSGFDENVPQWEADGVAPNWD